MSAGELGCITTPADWTFRPPPGAEWCADNGCFGAGYPGDEAWWQWVSALPTEGCAFVAAPDVVGDAAATLERSRPWLARVRGLGFPAAFVAQNGAEVVGVPWGEFDVLFLGGDTAWKLGPHARALAAEAKARGKRVHMGRVNSARRMRYAAAIGCDSADGTYIAFGPDRNLPIVLGWLREVRQEVLW